MSSVFFYLRTIGGDPDVGGRLIPARAKRRPARLSNDTPTHARGTAPGAFSSPARTFRFVRRHSAVLTVHRKHGGMFCSHGKKRMLFCWKACSPGFPDSSRSEFTPSVPGWPLLELRTRTQIWPRHRHKLASSRDSSNVSEELDASPSLSEHCAPFISFNIDRKLHATLRPLSFTR